MIVGVDQSKRSTGVVVLDNNGNMVGFKLITPPIEIDNEILIDYQWAKIRELFESVGSNHIDGVALEGAAFHALGKANDLLWGIQWYVRTRLKVEYPDISIGIINVATWRSTLLTKIEQKEWKIKYGGKIGLKHAIVSKLPPDVRIIFENYLINHKEEINAVKVKDWKPGSKSREYEKCIFDLADAYGIAFYRLSLCPKQSKLIRRKS